MKILYDHQIFTAQKYGGISRYFSQIISNLPKEIEADISIKYSNNEYIKNLIKGSKIEELKYPIERFLPGVEFLGKLLVFNFVSRLNPFKVIDPSVFNKNLSIELLKKQDFDIFHPTYYDDYFLDFIGKKPFVLTIHDMIHELYPEMLKDTDTILKKANLASKASHIIAVSERTKMDIIDILNIREEKISVVYHGSSIQKRISNTLYLPSNYLLYVGERLNYKNFTFFAYAIKTLLDERKDLNVICTGSSFNKEEQKLLKGLKLTDRFIHLFINEDQFYEVFHKARAMVFPSYYEGFGIPIIEAFDSECPVILSNSSCFPEIAKQGAIYFEPKSKNQLISAITKVLDEQNLRNELIREGNKRLDFFSWSKSAQETLNIYKKIIQ
ncbi:MAG: glycosyltransferase family 1 protein [Bacteroidales bacterium]|nr:glycosyltransferase family 1 protein [Bacteroidales bacterium]